MWQRLKSAPIKFLAIFNLLINLSVFLFIALTSPDNSLPAILHYRAGLGPDWLGAWSALYSLGLAGFLIFIINSVLAGIFRNKTFSFLLLGTAFMAQIFLTISAIMLVLIN